MELFMTNMSLGDWVVFKKNVNRRSGQSQFSTFQPLYRVYGMESFCAAEEPLYLASEMTQNV